MFREVAPNLGISLDEATNHFKLLVFGIHELDPGKKEPFSDLCGVHNFSAYFQQFLFEIDGQEDYVRRLNRLPGLQLDTALAQITGRSEAFRDFVAVLVNTDVGNKIQRIDSGMAAAFTAAPRVLKVVIHKE